MIKKQDAIPSLKLPVANSVDEEQGGRGGMFPSINHINNSLAPEVVNSHDSQVPGRQHSRSDHLAPVSTRVMHQIITFTY